MHWHLGSRKYRLSKLNGLFNRAPAIDCSIGRATFAMKIAPAANTISAPNADLIAAGKPKAGWVDDVLMVAKGKLVEPVRLMPNATGQY